MALVWAIRASDRDAIPLDWANRVAYGLEAQLSAVPDRILVNSQRGFLAARQRGIHPERMQVVPNGFDVARFDEDPAGRARVRAELGLSPDQVAIGLVARLDPIKDHASFLLGAAIALRHRADLRFVLVGDGPAGYRAELDARARSYGLDMIWAGSRSDMPAVYSALDAVCLSSLSEGFPNVVAEAMACGRPCVVTDVGDAAQIVGDTGVVVPAGNAVKLGHGMLRLLAAPRAGTRRRIVELFSTEALVARTLDIFAELRQRGSSRYTAADSTALDRT
jgi:glycosyltransferase involved in cell wall biosynthesis